MKTANRNRLPVLEPGSLDRLQIHRARILQIGSDPVKEFAEAVDAEENFIRDGCQALTSVCHGSSYMAGWWHNPKTGEPLKGSVPEKLMLIVSEISEAMEADRKGLMDDKLPHRAGIEVELADAVIRIFDLAGAMQLDLGGAIIEKLEFNRNRADHKPASRAANGKAY